jgi:membrane associated rhomboid family serine protease
MFIPLKDNLKSINFPALTVLLIVVNCFAFVMFEGTPQDAEKTIVLYGAIPYEMTHAGMQCIPTETNFRCAPTRQIEQETQLKFPGAWETVGSSMFLHISWFHLIGNMLFLFVFGRAVEDTLGRLSFFLFYLVGGAAAVLGHTLFDPSSQIPCVGASGAIAAVMGAYFVMFPKAKVLSLFIVFPCRPQAVWVLGTWLVEQMLIAWNTVGSGVQGGTAVFAHFGGFFAGCALTYVVLGKEEIEHQRLRARVISGHEKLQRAEAALPAGYAPPIPQYPGQPMPAPQFVTGAVPPQQRPAPTPDQPSQI